MVKTRQQAKALRRLEALNQSNMAEGKAPDFQDDFQLGHFEEGEAEEIGTPTGGARTKVPPSTGYNLASLSRKPSSFKAEPAGQYSPYTNQLQRQVDHLSARNAELEAQVRVDDARITHLEKIYDELFVLYKAQEQRTLSLENLVQRSIAEQAELSHTCTVLETRHRLANDQNIVRKLKPQVFDGKGDLDIYLESFEEVARAQGWNEEQKALMLKTHVKDSAAVLISGAAAKTYDAYKDALREGLKESADHYRSKLQMIKQKDGQSIRDLAVEVGQLGKMAYGSDANPAKDVAVRDAFIRALNDTSLRTKVRDAGPQTLKEAQEAAKKFLFNQELAKSEADGATQSKVRVKEIKVAEKESANLVKRMDALAADFKKFKAQPGNTNRESSETQPSRGRGRGKGNWRERGNNRPAPQNANMEQQAGSRRSGGNYYQPTRSQPVRYQKSEVCHRCGQSGHRAYECVACYRCEHSDQMACRCEAPAPSYRRTGRTGGYNYSAPNMAETSENASGQGPPPQPMSRQ